MENKLVQITQNIAYLPSSRKPLSSEVIFIKTEKATWIFDVGFSKDAAQSINSISGTKNVVISHFHFDHSLNLPKISCDNLFVSKYTKRYTLKGTVLQDYAEFNENPTIQIYEMPSSHAKGCLILVCGDYAFMGDSTYAKERKGNHTYNAQLLQQGIQLLEKLNCRYVCLDHDKNFIQERTDLIALLKKIYGLRKPNESTISVEMFFNPDGSVKENPPEI